MPSHHRFLRRVRVEVGDDAEQLRVDNLYIRFRLRCEATDTPPSGHVDVYNLNERSEVRIRERGRLIKLFAGYEGDELPIIFDGNVRRVERLRAELDRITRMHVGGRPEVDAPERSIFTRGYEENTPTRDIVRDGVEHLGLEVGQGFDLIPSFAAEVDAFTYNGDTRVMISQRLRPLGIEWYEEGGVAKFSLYAVESDDRPEGIVISEQTGMIGTPTVTDDGVRVRTLLDSRLTLGTTFTIKSSVIDDPIPTGDAENLRAAEIEDGRWKTVEVLHHGDNREGEFSTTVEGRPV